MLFKIEIRCGFGRVPALQFPKYEYILGRFDHQTGLGESIERVYVKKAPIRELLMII